MQELPTWLECLLKETFFNVCMIHEDAKKNEKNIFCVDCCEAICHHCVVDHNSHRLLQVYFFIFNFFYYYCFFYKFICFYINLFVNFGLKFEILFL